MAQLKWMQWTTKTKVGLFNDSVRMMAALSKDFDTRIWIDRKDGEILAVEIHQPERLQDSASEEITIRFDDEAIETISVTISGDSFLLFDLEESYKDYGNYDSVELARRLTRHGKFSLRYQGVTLAFEYDQASAKKAIGEVFEHCGHELEPSG